jgi:hypothetical protein
MPKMEKTWSYSNEICLWEYYKLWDYMMGLYVSGEGRQRIARARVKSDEKLIPYLPNHSFLRQSRQ